MCIDYDVTDAGPTSAAGVMRNVSSTMSNIYSDSCLQGLKSLSRLPKYFTNVNIPVGPSSGAAFAQAFQGNVWVAVEGVANSTQNPVTVGYLIAEYDIEFFTPQ